MWIHSMLVQDNSLRNIDTSGLNLVFARIVKYSSPSVFQQLIVIFRQHKLFQKECRSFI
jgi:hypothetical protein